VLETVTPVLDTITDTTTPVLETVTPLLDTVTDTITPVLETVTNAVAPVVDTITDTTATALGTVGTASPLDTLLTPSQVTGTSTTAPAPDTVSAPATDPPAPATDPSAPNSDPSTTATPDQSPALTGADSPSWTTTAPSGEAAPVALTYPAPPTETIVRGGTVTSSRAISAGDPTHSLQVPAAPTFTSVTLMLSSTPTAHQRLAPADAPAQAPDAPQAPSLPFSGSTASSGLFSSAALFAILVALSALALSQFGRLQLMPVRWRCTAFIALLERPG
jgi:hypothetical protein